MKFPITAPTILKQTLGTKLSINAKAAKTLDPWVYPYMYSVPPWQPSTAYKLYQVRVNGGNLYVCTTAGTSASSGGPTQTNNVLTTDGSAVWSYFGTNTVTSDPSISQPAWGALTVYAANQQVINNGLVYACVVGGTSAASGGPTGTSNAISDGATVIWTYMGVYALSPYVRSFPLVSLAFSTPSGLTNTFTQNIGPNFYAISAWPISGGNNYAVGDTVTLTGGTFSTAISLTVTSVLAGAITSVAVKTPGAYTVLGNDPLAQGSTSGSGTGATFTIKYNPPGFLAYRACFNAGAVGSYSGRSFVYQTHNNYAFNTNMSPKKAIEFWTDAPKFALQYGGGTAPSCVTLMVSENGGPFVRINLDAFPFGNSGINYLTIDYTATSGRKDRLYRYESTQGDVVVPSIVVDGKSTVWAPSSDERIQCAAISDSIWDGDSPIGPYVSGNSVATRLGHKLGWDVWSFSQVSTGYVNPASGSATFSQPFGFRIPQALDKNPDIMLFMGSTNDCSYNNYTVTGATGNGVSPIVLTVASTTGITTGDSMTFVNAVGNTAINGTFNVTVVDATHISLNGSTGNGAWVSGGLGLDTTPITTAALADYRLCRSLGFTGPIIILGLWSVSVNFLLVVEQAVQAAFTAFNDPNSYFIPIDQDPFLPWIQGGWNNNPAPNGRIQTSAANSGIYINTLDNVHPIDLGTEYLATRAAVAIESNVIPNIL
jgi:hypothetical protein